MLISTNNIPRYRRLGKQENSYDPRILDRLYCPISLEEWLIIHYDEETHIAECFYSNPTTKCEFRSEDLDKLENWTKKHPTYAVYRDKTFQEKGFLECYPLLDDFLVERQDIFRESRKSQEITKALYGDRSLEKPKEGRKSKKKRKNKNKTQGLLSKEDKKWLKAQKQKTKKSKNKNKPLDGPDFSLDI